MRVFFDNFAMMVSPVDALAGVVKAGAFGLAISLVSTTVGLRAQGGGRAVGQAAGRAVELCCAAIFLLDFLTTAALARLWA